MILLGDFNATAKANKAYEILTVGGFLKDTWAGEEQVTSHDFTGKAGNNTPLKETIRSFKELCAGKWDHLPESAFMYVGTVEEAAAKAEKMTA